MFTTVRTEQKIVHTACIYVYFTETSLLNLFILWGHFQLIGFSTFSRIILVYKPHSQSHTQHSCGPGNRQISFSFSSQCLECVLATHVLAAVVHHWAKTNIIDFQSSAFSPLTPRPHRIFTFPFCSTFQHSDIEESLWVWEGDFEMKWIESREGFKWMNWKKDREYVKGRQKGACFYGGM